MSPATTRKIVNFVWFQSIWLLVILYQYEWMWLVCLLLVSFFLMTDDRATDLTVIALVGVTGVIIDSLLTIGGVFVFSSAAYVLPIPLWLIALWLAFAGTLRHSLRYFIGQWWLCVAAGAVFGPLSYYGGVRLGAVSFGYSLPVSLGVLSLVWAMVLPFAFYIAVQTEAHRQHRQLNI